MEQNTKVNQKRKVILSFLGIVILLTAINSLLTLTLVSLGSLALMIIIFYWVNKNTIQGYQTARIWSISFFFLVILNGGYKSINKMDVVDLVLYLTFTSMMITVVLLINSICKSFESKDKQIKAPKTRPVFIYILLAILIIPVIIGYLFF